MLFEISRSQASMPICICICKCQAATAPIGLSTNNYSYKWRNCEWDRLRVIAATSTVIFVSNCNVAGCAMARGIVVCKKKKQGIALTTRNKFVYLCADWSVIKIVENGVSSLHTLRLHILHWMYYICSSVVVASSHRERNTKNCYKLLGRAQCLLNCRLCIKQIAYIRT